jgi:3-isopropylmalate/(R)-2-methylmalate dehydratase small subunit
MSSRAPFTRLAARAAVVARDDVDTDQIIPARFLKTTDKSNLARALFADWRYADSGAERPEFPLNAPDAAGAEILVGGRNFGCGSSREHAVWALAAGGFRAVIALSFADIFRNNAAKNGLLAVAVPEDLHTAIVSARATNPSLVVTIDLEAQRVQLPDGTSGSFPIDPFAKRCLLQGIDELGYLLSHRERIEGYEQQQQRQQT